jgi:uncharacterized CHY-type Zn-finger protein
MDLIALIKDRAKAYPCVACGQPLTDCGVKVLGKTDSHYTVEVTCGRCGVSFTAVLLLRRARHPEVIRTPAAPAITDDDLLDLHEALQSCTGPLTDLLQPRA